MTQVVTGASTLTVGGSHSGGLISARNASLREPALLILLMSHRGPAN